MMILGLTGSIGMGKTTTANMFREAGCPVHDADAVVHDLYRGEAAGLIEKAFPGTTGPGGVDRQKLSAAVLGKPDAMKRLEAIVHPLVAARRDAFLEEARQSGAPLAVLDIPLLFETGGDRWCDRVAVVSAPAAIQRERVLARDGMNEEKFAAILARQIPDAEKRARADYVIDTSQGIAHARRQVLAIIAAISGQDENDA